MTNVLPSRREAVDMLWRKGVLYWKLDSAQKKMYDTFSSTKALIPVFEVSRRVGKSFTLCLLATETALKGKNRTIHYACPTAVMATKIVVPIFRELFGDCPEDLRPKFYKHERAFVFQNGSKIQIEGADDGNAERLRGTATHLGIVDEAGFIKDLTYLVNDILLPQCLTTQGRLLLSSTPPPDLNHPFIANYILKAHKQKAYFKLDIETYLKQVENDPEHFRNRMTRKTLEAIKEELGETSPSFRREFMCEHLALNEGSVIPEFTPELEAEIVQDWKMPDAYDSYVAMDIGGSRDFTAILYAYYDFRNAKLIITDENLCKYEESNSTNIALLIRAKEAELWKDIDGNVKQTYLRIADNNAAILLNDLMIQHNLQFIPSKKDNKDAAINDLRVRLQQKNIIISPNCVNLIDHIRHATWHPGGKTFRRTVDHGHFDFIDALIYLVRNIHWHRNPYNSNGLANNHFRSPKFEEPQSKSVRAIKKIFKLNNYIKKR